MARIMEPSYVLPINDVLKRIHTYDEISMQNIEFAIEGPDKVLTAVILSSRGSAEGVAFYANDEQLGQIIKVMRETRDMARDIRAGHRPQQVPLMRSTDEKPS